MQVSIEKPHVPRSRDEAMNRILIAEDEARLSAFLEKGLRANGFVTTVAADGAAAALMARDADFDLLILDVGLPGKNGFEALHDVRRAGQKLPVIMLTVRRDPADKVAGLQGGADDYMTKPFAFEELLARVHARLRYQREPDVSTLRVGELVLDLRGRRAARGGITTDLTAKEFVLLETLMEHAGQVLSREQLLSHVWGYDYDPGVGSNVVEVYVRYLRRKLGADVIETVRGMGYCMRR
jgi:two-component system, OmpR family, copper resistance phosphate regulon response regulator CusR